MVARRVTLAVARRLAISKQRLAGVRRPPDAHGILQVVQDIGRLQLDPTSAVARSHLLVLQSRLGQYDPAELTQLLEVERALFEYRAYIVPTLDYPIYRARMRRFPAGDSKRARDIREWMRANGGLKRTILRQLQRRGALRLRDFEGGASVGWRSPGWNDERNVGQMLDFLLAQGKVLVTRRDRGQRVWDLAERVLPDAVRGQEAVPSRQAERLQVERELAYRGVATARDLPWAPDAPPPADVLPQLVQAGRAVPAEVDGRAGDHYIHVDDLTLLERLEAGDWQPRTTLLSPFDTLIHDRDRTEQLFGFRFRLEIYVPPAKREYGYFVLPVLHGDRLVGRIDPAYDRKQRVLAINAVYWEPDAPADGRPALEEAVEDLGRFLGAQRIDYR